MNRNTYRSAIPLFQKYTLEYLAEKTGYAINYLRSVRGRQYQVTRPFKQRMIGVLGESEEALFNPRPDFTTLVAFGMWADREETDEDLLTRLGGQLTLRDLAD